LPAARAYWARAPISVGPLAAGARGAEGLAALAVAAALGARVAREGARVRIAARPADHAPRRRVELDAGESATLARIATAIAALDPRCGEVRIAGCGTLERRSSAPLFRALRARGAELVCEGVPDGWPVVVRAAAPAGSRPLEIRDPTSSQEVSALVLSAGGAGGVHPTVVIHGRIPSRPYLDLTLSVLRRFGLRASIGPHPPDGLAISVTAEAQDGPGAVELEPDASLAGVALAAACLAGAELRVLGLGPRTPQGDARIAEHLRAFGCDAELRADGLRARGRPTRGAELDLAGEPDLAPVLAAVAADAALSCGARSRLQGLGTLAGKESDRLAGIAAALAAAGAAVARDGPEALAIAPGGVRAASVVLDARGDHRMAYLHALLGLVVPGVTTRDGRCVAKTWPRFWEDMAELGFEVVRGA
jgi:3-phosphoshikimate 1-carboxyvinyltransferase